MNREQLIEKAAKAIIDAQYPGIGWGTLSEDARARRRKQARAALAVFEEAHAVGSFVPVVSDVQETAHAPTDDEREALRREFEYRIRTGWALAHAYEKGTITAQRKKELIRDEIDGAMASLAVAGLFRRTVQGEPLPACGYCGDRLGAPGCPAHGDPQGEPSDAAVIAAMNALNGYDPPVTDISHWSGGYVYAMRAALRAAAEAEGGNR